MTRQYKSVAPVGDRVLVKARSAVQRCRKVASHSKRARRQQVEQESAVTAGGIVLPRCAAGSSGGSGAHPVSSGFLTNWPPLHSSALNKPTTGTVAAVGDGKNAKVGRPMKRIDELMFSCLVLGFGRAAMLCPST